MYKWLFGAGRMCVICSVPALFLFTGIQQRSVVKTQPFGHFNTACVILWGFAYTGESIVNNRYVRSGSLHCLVPGT